MNLKTDKQARAALEGWREVDPAKRSYVIKEERIDSSAWYSVTLRGHGMCFADQHPSLRAAVTDALTRWMGP